jgi:hypothetical protein
MKSHKTIRKEFLVLGPLLLSGCQGTSGYVANPDGNNNGATLYCSLNGGMYNGSSSSTGAQGRSFFWNFNGSGGVSVMASPAGINPPLSTYSITSSTIDGTVGEFPNPSSLIVGPSDRQDILDDVVIPQQTRAQIRMDYIRYEGECANKFG